MRKKLFGVLAPAVLAAASIVPLSAAPAAADPPCAMDVYAKRIGEREFQVTVARNRCNRPVRAIMDCRAAFGVGGISRGPVVTSGVSKTLCSRNTMPTDRGWDVYENGQWKARWGW
ncbi:hypothetical protein ABZO31_22610 [Streptomyces sp. HUAS MG47]|uniref:hypothetical protein n=1 Tax=Streptomyces solicamelliae TaxID=3231716 RepID=UPI003877A9BE